MDDSCHGHALIYGARCKRGRKASKAKRTFLRSFAAIAVLLGGLCSILWELAGESWFIKGWIIQPAMRSVGVIVDIGKLEYSLLTGEFSLSHLEWSNSIYDGNQVAIDGITEELSGDIEFSLFPWRVTVNKTRATGAYLGLVVLSDAECRWARGEDYILPPLPPPYAGAEPVDFMWEMPQELPQRTKGEPLGKPWFVPSLSLRELNVADAFLFVEWHHNYGSREYMRINDIALEIDEFAPGQMGNMVFEASGGSFESDFVNLFSGPLTGTSRLTLGRDGYLDVETWQSELNDFRSVVFGVEWPNSKLYAKGRSDGVNWYFDRVSGVSCLEDGQGAFELAGLITSWGFLVFPGSTIRCDREAVNQWFPRLAVENIIWDIAVSGGGEFEQPCFDLDMTVANSQDLPHNFSCHASFKLGTDIYNETVWLRGFFLQAAEDIINGSGEEEKVEFLQAAFSANEFAGYGYGVEKFLNNNTLLLTIKDFPVGGFNQLCGIQADSTAALATGKINGNAVLELKAGFDVPESLQCHIYADEVTTVSADILSEPASAAIDFALSRTGGSWELADIKAHLYGNSGTVAKVAGNGVLQDDDMIFNCVAAITELYPGRLGIAGKEEVRKILDFLDDDAVSMETVAGISASGISIEELSVHAKPFDAVMQPVTFDYDSGLPESFWQIWWQDWYPGNIKEPVTGNFAVNITPDKVGWHGNILWSGWQGDLAGGFDFRELLLSMEKMQMSHHDFGNWETGSFAVNFCNENPIFTDPVELYGEVPPAIVPGFVAGTEKLKGNALFSSVGDDRYKLELQVNPDRSSFAADTPGLKVSKPFFSAIMESDIAGNFNASGVVEHKGFFELEAPWQASGQFPDINVRAAINKLHIPAVSVHSNDGTVKVARKGETISMQSDILFDIGNEISGRNIVDIARQGNKVDLKEFVLTTADSSNSRIAEVSAKGSGDENGINIDARFGFSIPLLEAAMEGNETGTETGTETETAENLPEENKNKAEGTDYFENIFFDFGDIPAVVNIEFENCELAPDYLLNGSAGIKTRQNRMDVAGGLVLNDGEIDLQLNGTELDSENKNIDFDIQVKGLTLQDRAEDDNNIYCKNLLFTGKAPLATGYKLADNMTAWCSGEFSDIRIRNTIFDTFAGKALMTPLELLLRVRSAMPDPGMKMLGYESISDDFTDLYAHTDVFKFDKAVLEARTQNGKFVINKCVFSSKVHELRFPGTVCWGSCKDMNVRASYCVGSLVIPVTINGTTADPEIVWADAVWRMVSENIMEVGRDSVHLMQDLNPWHSKK